MDQLENIPSTEAGDNQETIESLRFQMNLLFGCLLIASITLTAFLGVQARRASMDVINLKKAAADSTQELKQENAYLDATYARLKEFAQTHPDFDKVVLSNFHPNTNSAPVQPVKK